MSIPSELMTGVPLSGQHSFGPPPPRRPGSLRRTTSLQAHFPDGLDGPIAFEARGRDLYTGNMPDAPRLCASEEATIFVSQGRRVVDIQAKRSNAALARLHGARVSGELRAAMSVALADDVAESSLLYRLLDDLAGATFLSSVAWFSWYAGRPEDLQPLQAKLDRSVEGVCISFSPGSPSLTADGRSNEPIADHPDGLPLFDPGDDHAWHPLADLAGPNFWRIRHSDLWLDADGLHAAVGFQDSAARPGTTLMRRLFHEYRLHAVIDPTDMTLRAIEVQPGILPYRTCLAAPATARNLIGLRVADFGAWVPDILQGTAGCTHLNDALRAMQDIAGLTASLMMQNN